MELAWVSYYTLSFAHFRYFWSTYDTWLSTLLSSLLFFFVLLLTPSEDWEAGRFDLKTLGDWEAGWGR